MDGLECSEIKKSELEFSGRTDAEYYQKKFLQYQNIIEAHNILPLSKVADFLIGPFGSAYDTSLYVEQSKSVSNSVGAKIMRISSFLY